MSPQGAYNYFSDPLVSVVATIEDGDVRRSERRRLSWPNSFQTFRAFFSPLSSPAKSPRCPLPSPSFAGSGRATPANNENPAMPRRPSNRPRLLLPQTRRSPAVEATRTVVAKIRIATTQAPQLPQVLANSPERSLRGFVRHLHDDRVKPARARPFLSNLASDTSQLYVRPFTIQLRS